MDKFAQIIDEKLASPMARLAEQRHLRAIRDGIISTLPLIIVASMFLVIGFLPNQLPETWGLSVWIKEHAGDILLPHRVSMFIMTLYAVFGIGYSLAKSYDLDPLSGAIISELAYLLTIVPVVGPEASEAVVNLSKNNAELAEYISSVPQGWLMPMANLGSSGMFVGIISAIIAVEIYRVFMKKGLTIKMPPQVPESVARSFEALVPTAVVMLLFATLSMWLKIDLHGIIGKLIAPLVSASDTLASVLILVFLQSFFWIFGIHGASIVGTVARPIWLMLIDQNAQAFANGASIPNVAAEPFYQWFIYIGGSGATIGLAILLLFRSKSAYGKTLGRTGIIPAIFNINEPIIFGAPIVLNPILMIPFVAVPMILSIIAWIATNLGLVGRVITIAPWTLPGPIGAFFATGDIRASILNILLIILSIILYYPFFKIYDKKLLEQEQASPEEE
jgi:PTS system cellobiose-specific IIC component